MDGKANGPETGFFVAVLAGRARPGRRSASTRFGSARRGADEAAATISQDELEPAERRASRRPTPAGITTVKEYNYVPAQTLPAGARASPTTSR